jgi:hypothetical protein
MTQRNGEILGVTFHVTGNGLPVPGTDAYERLRTAIWAALDGVAIEGADNRTGPYTLTVTGVRPIARDRAGTAP